MRIPATVKADYLTGMTPKELAAKYKSFTASAIGKYASKKGWPTEGAAIEAKQGEIIAETNETAIRALKAEESADMDILIKKAKGLIKESKPSAYRTKFAADIMKIAYERKYKALNIPDKVQHGGDAKNPIKHEHEVSWPQL